MFPPFIFSVSTGTSGCVFEDTSSVVISVSFFNLNSIFSFPTITVAVLKPKNGEETSVLSLISSTIAGSASLP